MFNKNCCRQNFGTQNYGMPNYNVGCCQRQMTQPVIEPTMTNCIQKDFYHEVPQE